MLHNVEVGGDAPLFGAASPGLPGWGAGDTAPSVELNRPGGASWTLYENSTATGFPEGQVVVNKAAPAFNLLRRRIKKL